jgi:YVTN family beta-propeller protein
VNEPRQPHHRRLQAPHRAGPGNDRGTCLALGLCLALTACPAPADRAPERDRQEPAPAELQGVAYTADESANSVTRIDLASSESREVPLEISPHNIQISGDGSMLFVVGPLAAAPDAADHVHEGSGRLVILDPQTLAELRPPVLAGEHPAHVVADADNRFVYISDSGPNSIVVVDLEAGAVVREIPTCAYPHGLRLSPDDRELYVACVEGNAVAVIDTATGSEAARIEVGRAPVQVGFTPDGRQVYVSLRDEDAVAAIDTQTRTVLRSIPVGRGPIQVYATPDGRYVYVANEGTREQPDSTVSVIDVEAGAVATTITTGSGAHGAVVADDGELALISNLFANTVSVIEVATQRVVATYPVGEGPAGITYRPARGASPARAAGQ